MQRQHNVKWIKDQGIGPFADYIFTSNGEMNFKLLHEDRPVAFDGPVEPHLPMPISSWVMCRGDGLVEFGWIEPGFGGQRFWGLWLTGEGRKELLAA
jgi:hypothetical protein